MKQEASSSKQPKHNPKIVAAIPCLNEDRYIGSVVLKVKKFVDSVVVIDDGSSDDTAEVAAGAGATVHKHDKKKRTNDCFREYSERFCN